MPLDDVFRVRVEKDLQTRFEKLAKRLHTTPSALARRLMWERLEQEEHLLKEDAVHYGRKPRRGT